MKETGIGIALVFLGLALGLTQTVVAAEGGPSPLSGTVLYDYVKTYAAFGEHRTGGKGDLATSRWIAEELQKAGLQTELKPWTLKQFFLESCALTVDGKALECFPGWFPNTRPVKGKLTVYDPAQPAILKGNLAFVGSKYGAVSNTGMIKLVEQVRDAGGIGLIVAVRNFGDAGLLTAANAEQKGQGPEYHQAPLPLPTVIIAGRDEAELLKAASEGKEAAFQVLGDTRENTTAYNVVATLKRGDRWIVVTTPTAGWFECAGERGPGVALFLGLARWAAQNSSPYSFIFIANSGHEMAYMGARYAFTDYLPQHGITKDNVVCWFHLGAAIACRAWKKGPTGFEPLSEPNKIYYLASVPELLPAVQAAFGGIPGLTIGSGQYAGELIHIVKNGFKGCGFFGANYFFHTPMDKPQETGPELLEPVGKALTGFFTALTHRP
jgi:hypothetical protein